MHRRILYSMHEQGYRPDRAHVKSARVVGDVMGKYHPHGDTAIYDAMVRLAQDFSLNVPLIDGHGNFGCPDDGPAASRYTEARMSREAMLLVGELGEDTVDFEPNYDGSLDRADGAAGRVPEPAGQRHLRHRGRDGHQHDPAQPRRGRRRGPVADQPPGRRRWTS